MSLCERTTAPPGTMWAKMVMLHAISLSFVDLSSWFRARNQESYLFVTAPSSVILTNIVKKPLPCPMAWPLLHFAWHSHNRLFPIMFKGRSTDSTRMGAHWACSREEQIKPNRSVAFVLLNVESAHNTSNDWEFNWLQTDWSLRFMPRRTRQNYLSTLACRVENQATCTERVLYTSVQFLYDSRPMFVSSNSTVAHWQTAYCSILHAFIHELDYRNNVTGSERRVFNRPSRGWCRHNARNFITDHWHLLDLKTKMASCNYPSVMVTTDHASSTFSQKFH